MLQSLPIATLYLTERCNSRCVTCDYWRHGRVDLTVQSLERLLPELEALGTEVIVFSGGEPLIHPQWLEMARLLKARGLRLWLLTSGLSLAKHAGLVSALFESATVSLDGACARTYQAIRGVDAFDNVCRGIAAAAALGVAVSIRTTVQRANYGELSSLVTLAREQGAARISFLAADVSNPHAFGRDLNGGFASDIALRDEDLPKLEQALASLALDHADAFRSGFIAESVAKLRRILDYYRAVRGSAPFPPVRCNAPEFSAVIEASGRVRPCFFIAGPEGAHIGEGLPAALNGESMRSLRHEIRIGARRECERCVCSMWRDLPS